MSGMQISNDTRQERTMNRSPSQSAAETLWSVATSEDRAIASSSSTVYRLAERTLVAALRAEYRLSQLMATRVRDLLAEYGPHDNLMWVRWDHEGRAASGIESYVLYVKLPENRGRSF
jgi:hypothetical protein